MVKEKSNSRSRERDVTRLLLLVAVVVLLNFISAFLFKRFDLTSEKRYTLAESTRKLLKNVDEEMLFKVYLEGEFNPAFTRLRNEAKEMLDQFRVYSGGNLQYEFINPNEESLTLEEKNNIQKQLNEAGIIPEEIIENSTEKYSAIRIWPGAVAYYKNKTAVWQIYTPQTGIGRDESVNNSVKELEYSLSNAIRKLQRTKEPEITFIEGHRELDTLRKYEFMRALDEYYSVNRTRIAKGTSLRALEGSDAIIITKPDTAFSDQEKYVIDQFIMRGGKVLWLIDAVSINMDTLLLKGYSFGLSRPLGIEDMLFRYGARVNPVLVQDMQCSTIPLNIGFKKGQPTYKQFNWVFHPLILPSGDHPIVKNLDVIKFEYVSQVDTISVRDVKKTILLTTSKNSRIQPAPARIFFGSAVYPIKESAFKDRHVPVAVLLEGTFRSFLEYNRLPMAFRDNPDFKIIEKSTPTKMIVIGDGDVAANEYQRRSGMIYPLGYDIYTQRTYANKTFLVNCVNYLLDDEGMLQLRAREVKLRMLDKKKIKQQRRKWQTINVALPLCVVILMGLGSAWLRKRNYTSKF